MAFERFLIAPFNSGLQKDLRPWLIPEDAFEKLINAYVFRGRIRKRFGSVLTGFGWSSAVQAPLFSRLRVQVGTTDAGGNLLGVAPGLFPVFKIGQAFSIGNEIFTVYINAPGNQTMLATNGTANTFSITTGVFNFVGATALTPVFYYPGDPVMGITIYESGTYNNQPTYAFDIQFAYVFVNGAWQRSGTAIWHGTDLNFFWTTNWQGTTTSTTSPPVLFVSNFNATVGIPAATDDPIWIFNGTSWTPLTGANAFYFRPNGGAPQTGPYVKTARIIAVFKNRLLLFDTIENDNSGGAGINTKYVNRLRFSAFASPFAPNAWYEPGQADNTGNPLTGIAIGADFIDAPTEEEIISAEFIKDRLIVFFQQSTWEIVYTGNEVEPFRWQKINTELGSQAQQSTVPFDQFILTMSNIGVHSCNGANVIRIDEKIPDQVFEISDKLLEIQRVAGVRDYFTEAVYWAYPSDEEATPESFPNRILVYNYRNNTWAINEDCITAFGFLDQSWDVTWADQTDTWEDAGFAWNSAANQAQFRQVLAGNQQGYVFMIARDVTRNAQVMQITNATTTGGVATLVIINHTLQVGPYSDYILIENSQGVTGLDGIYKVQSIVDKDTITIFSDFTGVYTGGGTASRVSNPQILSKQWNPFVQFGRNVYLARIDFGVMKTGDFGSGGQVTVDYFPSATELSMLTEGVATNSIVGTGVLETTPYDPIFYPLESVQQRLWHSIYFQSSGECIQIFIYMTEDQITQNSIALADFQLEGMVLHVSTTSSRLE